MNLCYSKIYRENSFLKVSLHIQTQKEKTMNNQALRNNRMAYILAVTLTLLMAVLVGCTGTATPSPEEKLAIQSTMNDYIQTKLASGGGTYDIEGTKSQFDYLHDGVKQDGDIFISCADFKSGTDVYDIDYYVKDVNGQLKVVEEVFHKKNGDKVNRTLWQE